MNATCPSCGHQFHAKHPHLTGNGFIPVRLHRRKKRTLYVRREDMDEDIAERLLQQEQEIDILKKKLMLRKPPGTKRCTSTVTDRNDEHRLFECLDEEGHVGPHWSGDATWTDHLSSADRSTAGGDE